MVSPLKKENGDAYPLREIGVPGLPATLNQASLNGDKVSYGSYRPFGDAVSAPYTTQYIATRGEGGWTSHAISPPRGRLTVQALGTFDNELKILSPDLCQSWWRTFTEPTLAPAAVSGYPNIYRRSEAGCGEEGWEALTTATPPHPAYGGTATFVLSIQGASADGTRTIYRANDNLTADTPDRGGADDPSLYYQEEGEGAPHYVCILPSGEPYQGLCTAGYSPSSAGRSREQALQNAISADGERVWWNPSISTTGAPHVYLREHPGRPQSALAHGAATGTGKITEGSTAVTSLTAASGKADFVKGSAEVTLVETSVGKFVPGQVVTAPAAKLPAGTTIVSVSGSTLTLSAAAGETGSEKTTSSKGPLPFEVGQAISGAGIPPGTTIEEAKSGELKLSKAATKTESSPVSLSATSPCTEAAKACTIAASGEAEELSGASEAKFWAAAEDGSAVLFTAKGVGVSDLYRFDVEGEKSTLIAHKAGGVMGASQDLSRLYFVSEEALTPANAQGAEPTPGKPNLYLYAEGEPASFHFIGTLADVPGELAFDQGGSDQNVTRVSPDGRHVAFMSVASLTGYDNTDAVSGKADAEVFLYDSTASGGQGKLTCASCNPTGARPQGYEFEPPSRAIFPWVAGELPPWQTSLYPGRNLSEDGARLYFNSSDALSPRDTNGALDVYQWQAPGSGGCKEADPDYHALNQGCVSLISYGQSSRGSEFVEASPDGSDVFFATLSSLVSQDYGLVDVYDARVNGGLPAPAQPAAQCEGEACQGAPQPPNDPTPSSASFEGAGNVREEPSSSARKACAKGKVKRHGSCVAKKHKKAAKRAKHKRRAGR